MSYAPKYVRSHLDLRTMYEYDTGTIICLVLYIPTAGKKLIIQDESRRGTCKWESLVTGESGDHR